MYVYNMHAWCPGKLEEVVRSPGTGFTDGSETPWRAGNGTQASTGATGALSCCLAPALTCLYFEIRGKGAREIVGTGDTQWVESFPGIHEALGLIPSTE